MRISLLTLGTRGDVQPYAELGRSLKKRGHEVLLSTGKNFSGMATEYGINFNPVEADFNALINSDEGKAMMKNPFLARKHFINIVQPMMVGAMKRFYEIASESDCVLFHVKSLGDFFADQFPQKMVRANVVPALEPTSEFPNPVFSSFSLPKFLNRFTYKLADLGMAMMNNAIRQFRNASGLSPGFPKRLDLPSIYGISPYFLPKPVDFPSNSYFTGFWQSESEKTLPPDVVEFLSLRNLNVLITFGSMPFETKFNLQKSLIDLSKNLNIGIIVVKGWGFSDVSAVDNVSTIKVIDNAPFDKLIPKVNAVVHHGGIGTIAQCLRAGVPFLSCPVIYPMGDQHFWGFQAYKLGCSPKPVPLRKMTDRSLHHAVYELLTSARFKENSYHLSKKLGTENGLEKASDVIEANFADLH